MFEEAALRYEEAGDAAAAEVFRLGAAVNRRFAEEERMRWRWHR
jgi:hypothetical protein